MKTLFIAITLVIVSGTIQAQDSMQIKKTHRSEVGIDITGMLRQFLNFGVQYVSEYNPNYFITYRYHFKKSNLRCGLGGGFSERKITPFSDQDPKKLYYSSYSVNLRVGYEFYSNIGKHWQLFYGADFRPAFVYTKNEGQYANGDYIYGNETMDQVYGLAPILGVRFKIIPRISITTETNFAFNFESTATRQLISERYVGGPTPPTTTWNKTFAVSGSYKQPLSLILTFDI